MHNERWRVRILFFLKQNVFNRINSGVDFSLFEKTKKKRAFLARLQLADLFNGYNNMLQ